MIENGMNKSWKIAHANFKNIYEKLSKNYTNINMFVYVNYTNINMLLSNMSYLIFYTYMELFTDWKIMHLQMKIIIDPVLFSYGTDFFF